VHAELENREYAPRLYRPRELRPNSKPDPSEMMLAQYNSLIENSGTLHGFAYMPGFDPALSYQLRIVWDESVERKAGRQMLDLFAVEYAVFSSRQAHRLPMERKASADGLSLVHNRQARPRAFVSNRWSWVSDQYAAVDHLFRPGRDPREVVLVGTAPAGEIAPVEPPTLKPCALVFDTPERVVVTCQSEVPAVAVLLDSYAKGWTATVDGDAREIYRAEVLTRGILLESGEHEIVFSYRTPGLRAGLLVSMLAWLGLAAMLISSRRRRPR